VESAWSNALARFALGQSKSADWGKRWSAATYSDVTRDFETALTYAIRDLCDRLNNMIVVKESNMENISPQASLEIASLKNEYLSALVKLQESEKL